jgi:hypothetical protein
MGCRPIGRPRRSEARNPPDESSVSARYGSPRNVVDGGHGELVWLWCSSCGAPECIHSVGSISGSLRWVVGSFMVLPSALWRSMATVRARCPRLRMVAMMCVLRVVWWRLVEEGRETGSSLRCEKQQNSWVASRAAHAPEEVPIPLSQSDMSSRVLSWIERDSARMRISLCMNVRHTVVHSLTVDSIGAISHLRNMHRDVHVPAEDVDQERRNCWLSFKETAG